MARFLYLIKNHMNQLEASDIETERILDKIKAGEVLKLSYKKARNYENLKRWRVLVKKVFENQERYDNEEDFIVEIKLKCGYYKEHITTKGKIIYIPKSLAFDEIDETEFQEFFGKAIQACLSFFVDPDNDDLINELIRF